MQTELFRQFNHIEKPSQLKISLALMMTALLFSLTTPTEANAVPKSCYRKDGLIDLAKCKGNIFQVPYDVLNKGYYNNFGQLEPGLPDNSLWSFDGGTQIEGNILRMGEKLTWSDVKKTAEEQGIDISKLKGGMATDSSRYLNTFAWLRAKGSGKPFVGPIFVTSNAAPVHLRQRACKYQSVGEVNSSVYRELGGRSGPFEVEVVFTDTNTFTAPDAGVDSSQFIDYPQAFLNAANYQCP